MHSRMHSCVLAKLPIGTNRAIFSWHFLTIFPHNIGKFPGTDTILRYCKEERINSSEHPSGVLLLSLINISNSNTSKCRIGRHPCVIYERDLSIRRGKPVPSISQSEIIRVPLQRLITAIKKRRVNPSSDHGYRTRNEKDISQRCLGLIQSFSFGV